LWLVGGGGGVYVKRRGVEMDAGGEEEAGCPQEAKKRGNGTPEERGIEE